MKKNKKLLIVLIIIAAVIIAGVVMTFIKGFSYDSYYSNEICINYRDIVKQVAVYGIVSLVLILAYYAIKYRKQEWYKKLILTIATVSIAELAILSIIVICGVPLSIYIMPILMGVYVITILALSFYFEKK